MGRVFFPKKAEWTRLPSTNTAVTWALMDPMKRTIWLLYTVRSASSATASLHMSARVRYWSLKESSTWEASTAGLLSSTFGHGGELPTAQRRERFGTHSPESAAR